MVLPVITEVFPWNRWTRAEKLYQSNPDLWLVLKLLPALASEKLENVNSSFKLVDEDIQEVCEKLSVDSSEVIKLMNFVHFSEIHSQKKIWESFYSPIGMELKKAALKGVARTANAVVGCILASKFSFRGCFQVYEEHWKIWRMPQLKSNSFCSQQQVWSFRGERNNENWRRRWRTHLNVIWLKIKLFPESDGFFVNVKLNVLNKIFFIARVSCLNFWKIKFFENYKAFPSESLTQEIGRYPGLSFSSSHIPIFQAPETENLGKSGFKKSWMF